jgi:hypothetical protein
MVARLTVLLWDSDRYNPGRSPALDFRLASAGAKQPTLRFFSKFVFFFFSFFL